MDDTAIQTTPKAPDSTAIQTEATAARLTGDLGLIKKPAWTLLDILGAVASLRLTVVLLGLGLLLVFFGTLAQIDEGLHHILSHYFRWFIVWIPLQLFVRFGQIFLGFDHMLRIPGAFPFPGGWTIGLLMLVNLTAAHAVLLHRQWRAAKDSAALKQALLKRSGIYILHAGVVVLMLGELITGVFAVESRMTIWENGSASFVEDHQEVELAIIDPSDAQQDDVTVVPGSFLRKGGTIQHDALPFDIEVVEYLVNTTEPGPGKSTNVTAGAGKVLAVAPLPPVSGTDAENIDFPAAYLAFKDKQTGQSLGTYLVSAYLTQPVMVAFKYAQTLKDHPQRVAVNGKQYEIQLRSRREYKPYTIYLQEFHHDVYEGTTIPKNFSSKVNLVDPSRGENREVDIFMNNPLRYQGDTFYQASFLPGDTGTILQVVRNPGAEMPYISCILVTVGMLIHFCIGLGTFLNAKLKPPSLFVTQGPPLARLFPWLVVGLAGLYLLLKWQAIGNAGLLGFHWPDFGRLPVLHGGRVKPFDTLARDSLMVISNRTYFYDEQGVQQPATRWLIDVMVSRVQKSGTPTAFKHRVFRIDNPEVLSLLGLQARDGYRYALAEFGAKLDVLSDAASRAQQIDPKQRPKYEQKVLEVAEHVKLMQDLADLSELRLVPPTDAEDGWLSFPQAVQQARASPEKNPAIQGLAGVLSAYVEGNSTEFNRELEAYHDYLATHPAAAIQRADYEFGYNSFEPFYICIYLYAGVFLLACASWLGWQAPLRSAAFWLAVLTLVVHTSALIARMYLMDRWGVFVTNLYATAVFIGWCSLILSLILEIIFPLGIATAVAGGIGFLTTILAHHLARSGDTLGMLQAVLDTNFWLATHVTIINIGYASTFVAGCLAVVYLVLGEFTPLLKDAKLSKTLSQMIYGIVCFSVLFSFVGTVLGGIWADQSWGRFWGWDPKENGALVIVLWNALILHARWGGLVKQTGVAVLAVLGNMVTLWSWFGTNQLGVGLHAYGFSNTLATMCTVLWALHLAFVGMVLGRQWNRARPAAAA